MNEGRSLALVNPYLHDLCTPESPSELPKTCYQQGSRRPSSSEDAPALPAAPLWGRSGRPVLASPNLWGMGWCQHRQIAMPKLCHQPALLSNMNFKLLANAEPLGWVFGHISGEAGGGLMSSVSRRKENKSTTLSVRHRDGTGCYLHMSACPCHTREFPGQANRN